MKTHSIKLVCSFVDPNFEPTPAHSSGLPSRLTTHLERIVGGWRQLFGADVVQHKASVGGLDKHGVPLEPTTTKTTPYGYISYHNSSPSVRTAIEAKHLLSTVRLLHRAVFRPPGMLDPVPGRPLMFRCMLTYSIDKTLKYVVLPCVGTPVGYIIKRTKDLSALSLPEVVRSYIYSDLLTANTPAALKAFTEAHIKTHAKHITKFANAKALVKRSTKGKGVLCTLHAYKRPAKKNYVVTNDSITMGNYDILADGGRTLVFLPHPLASGNSFVCLR